MNDPFLDGLIGEWKLTGDMGGIPLQHDVAGMCVVGGLFVEMTFKQTNHDASSDRPPYEALYLLGYDAAAGVYVLHLFDTFGVTKDYKFGVGSRRGNTIEFVFDYSSGPFFNSLERHKDGSWTWLLEFLENGARKVFATKRMVRI